MGICDNAPQIHLMKNGFVIYPGNARAIFPRDFGRDAIIGEIA